MSQVAAADLEWLPADRAAEFRRRFCTGAEHTHTHAHDGIVFDRDAVLQRVIEPYRPP